MSELRPQPGAQIRFLKSRADIAIYGGSAGSGKTAALLLEAARHIGVSGYNCVIFRKEFKQIVSNGGIRDAAMKVYPDVGAVYRSQPTPQFIFPSGAKISFAHLNTEVETLAWQGSEVCLLAFDELTHFCLTPDHEVLTRDGWKNITDVVSGNEVLSLGVDADSCFIPVNRVMQFDYKGEMIAWDFQRGISTMVTPNHRMVVTSNNKRDRWKFVEAKDVENNTSYSVYRAGSPIEQTGEEYVYFDTMTGQGLGLNQNSAEKVSMYDYAEFMGWFLSEGSAVDTDSTSPFVSIRQTKPSLPLASLMERLPWRVKNDGDGGYRIFSRQLVSVLKPMGNLYEKRVPRSFFMQSPDVISRLLDAFALGDGSFTSENRNDGGISIGLANEGLIDDLQELYTLIGRVSVKSEPVRINRDGKVFTHWKLSVSKKDRQITQLKASGFRVDYTGKVWCLSVPGTHNFLVRHKGRCHFTGNSQYQFEYMMSRNRSTCGVRPLIRATTNPDSDSWVATFISWWINQETGFPIPERSGKLRYMIRLNGERIWGDSPEELVTRYDCDPLEAKSVTFVSAKITDNPILLKKDPGYLSNLKALSKVERARLLDGNWKIRPAAGMYFPRENHKIIDWLPQPNEMIKWVRSWDLAASEESEGRDPDWTVGLLVGRRMSGKVVIGDMIRVRRKAAEVRSLVKTMAVKDGRDVWVVLGRDPGQAGKEQAESYLNMLNGFTVVSRNITRSKTVMAEPAAALWQQGNIEVVRADWNEALLSEFEQFPEGRHDDIVDCLAASVLSLPGHSRPDYSNSGLSGRFKEIRRTPKTR